MTAFDLLLDELHRSCRFTPEQLGRMRAVFSSWSRETLRMPSTRRWVMDEARAAARRMAIDNTPRAVMRDRLVTMGVSRRTAYTLIDKARREQRQGAQDATQ